MRISIKAIGILLVMTAFIRPPYLDDSIEKPLPDNKTPKVLIAHGNTAFEKAVVDSIESDLKADGISIKIIDIRGISRENANQFDAVIMLNAVKDNKLINPASRFMRGYKKESGGYIFISTVSGREWSRKESEIDAISSSTEYGQSKAVANKILRRIRTVLSMPVQ